MWLAPRSGLFSILTVRSSRSGGGVLQCYESLLFLFHGRTGPLADEQMAWLWGALSRPSRTECMAVDGGSRACVSVALGATGLSVFRERVGRGIRSMVLAGGVRDSFAQTGGA